MYIWTANANLARYRRLIEGIKGEICQTAQWSWYSRSKNNWCKGIFIIIIIINNLFKVGNLHSLNTKLIQANKWVNDVSNWPHTDIGKVFPYIMKKNAFDTDYIGQDKAHKAYSYFMSGFMHEIFSHNMTYKT